MSGNVVNLDALIPREDFAVDDGPQQGTPLDKISIVHLEGPYFGPLLRKPDFQRETTKWTPAKVVDLIRAFVDADLIPAVILWRAGRYAFVIDGAHRLSALLAWVHDDYGDRKISLDFFGGQITDEQRKVAERTRGQVNKEIGSYEAYKAQRGKEHLAPAAMQKRLGNLAVNSVIAQWVPSTDSETAENSFFKINQAATPIDPTERRILKARRSASAIAARAIIHAGTGHKYWVSFAEDTKEEIEAVGSAIHQALYTPPMGGMPLTTLDVPVAGRGYNGLPFVFDLVNQANGVDVIDTTTKKEVTEKLPHDEDGKATLAYLKTVQKRVNRITSDLPGSLGIHPVVYFYTRSGTFQSTAFLATSLFLEDLAKKNKLNEFTRVRKDFEDFLIRHKEAMSLLTHKFGSGQRSLPWLQKYYWRVLEGLWGGKSLDDIQKGFAADPDFAFLTAPRSSGARDDSTKSKKVFSRNTKTAAFFATALPSGTRCKICGALVHRNSIHSDHIKRVRDGGSASVSNAQISHPYCDSTYKEKKVAA